MRFSMLAILCCACFCWSSLAALQHRRSASTSGVSNSMLIELARDATAQEEGSTAFKDGLGVALREFADAGADMEIGADLGVDLALDAGRRGHDSGNGNGGGGPATLADYCAGAPTSSEKSKVLKEGTRVKADWEDYGTMYPGKITDQNSNGTVDIKYDDGFNEDRVKPDHVKVLKKKGSKESTKESKPRDDPACKLLNFLEKLKQQLKALNNKLSKWVAAQRAKVAGEKPVPTPPPNLKPAGISAPSAAPSGEEQEDLEKLKEQLADRDAYISELEKQFAENEQELQKHVPAAGPAAADVQSVDDLIAEYKSKIAQRDERIQELLRAIEEQQEELARLSGKQLSLKDIEALVTDLEQDVAEAEKKRDELNKEGKLDPELRAILDAIIESIKKLRKKVDHLLALEAKAEADHLEAEREAEEAAAAARKKAEEDGASVEEAEKLAQQARKKARDSSRERVRQADLATMQKAKEVSSDLKEAEKGAARLDTGLHPHGSKWWRYRYEHSYIEALLMIFISFLMLLWTEVIEFGKRCINQWALPIGVAPKTSYEMFAEGTTHGGVLLVWLRYFAEQMMVCIFVFITVWMIAKTPLIEFFPMLIKPSDDMRVPPTAAEYRNLALDICTIFFFAIIFYFALMFAVARETRHLTQEMEPLERGEKVPKNLRAKARSSAAIAAFGGVALGVKTYEKNKKRFTHFMQDELQRPEATPDSDVQKIKNHLDGDFDKFPLATYLILNVRVVVSNLFFFGWVMWLPTICLFLTLMLLHRFAHIGYVRIMSAAGIVVLLLIGAMRWLIKRVGDKTNHSDDDDGVSAPASASTSPTPRNQDKTIHNLVSTELIMFAGLQFSLFFVCYGVARMICQPWMWELHFWPVLCLTIVSVVSATLFVWLVSPAIPMFAVAMSIPPYVDDENMKNMCYVAQKTAEELGQNTA